LRVVSTIERSGGRCRVVDLGKTKAARRTLVMPEFLRAVLIAHLERYPHHEWVFPAPKGGFLRYDNFRMRVWAPAVEQAGLHPLTFHCLRHTAAAFMIDGGADHPQLNAAWVTRTSARTSILMDIVRAARGCPRGRARSPPPSRFGGS
jgi:integrase